MLSTIWKRVRSFFTRLGWLKSTLIIALLAIIFVIGLTFLRGGSEVAATQETTPTVTVNSVANLSSGGSSLSVAGNVQSQTEATVRAEKSARVTSLNYALGDYVGAGAVIAELENASERASVLQAQGSVQAATAGANVSQTTLTGAQGGALSSLLSTYGTIEKTIHSDIDPMFSNPEGTQPQFTVNSSNSQAKINAENARVGLTAILKREQGKAVTLSSTDDLAAELVTTQSELRTIRDFLDTVISALNGGIATYGVTQTTIDTYKATATGARSTITTALSTLNGAAQTLATAKQNSTEGADTSSASQAALTQAQGTLAAAKANLEKSIIRAPISGTINSLDLKLGDFVQVTSPVVTVANNHALEVIAYVTAEDAPRIAVGDKATLDGGVTGTITRIAPALDPITKKIEVRVGLSSNTSGLVNGQSVVVNFVKSASTATKPSSGPVTIPITALKIGADTMVVFTLDSENKLVANPVVLGLLLGDRVEVKSGLTSDMQIVTDARGLQAGEVVIVKQ